MGTLRLDEVEDFASDVSSHLGITRHSFPIHPLQLSQ